jgi:hypothetical protein
MIFERIKSEWLAHNSYFIGSAGTAAVIDPRRDGDVYLDLAQRSEKRWPSNTSSKRIAMKTTWWDRRSYPTLRGQKSSTDRA